MPYPGVKVAWLTNPLWMNICFLFIRATLENMEKHNLTILKNGHNGDKYKYLFLQILMGVSNEVLNPFLPKGFPIDE